MRKAAVHLIFWIAFFLVWNRIMYFYIDNELDSLYFSTLDVSLIASAFYIIYLYIMPDYLRQKSILKLVLLSVLLMVVLSGLYSWIMWLFLQRNLVLIHFEFSWNYKDLQYNRLFIALVGVLAGCFVKLAVDRQQVSKRLVNMEKENSVAELTYLKAQINPHFLFNSLNSLYAQLELNSSEAKKTLLSISDLLRYQLYEFNADFIPVKKELAYLKDYFSLQSIRQDNCTTSFLTDGVGEDLLIAPLLLVPFIENAFKHASDYDDRENIIKVKIGFTRQELTFYCGNTCDIMNHRTPNAGKGIGLINVKKRLGLIYGSNYKLQEVKHNGWYEVTLKLHLKKC